MSLLIAQSLPAASRHAHLMGVVLRALSLSHSKDALNSLAVPCGLKSYYALIDIISQLSQSSNICIQKSYSSII